MTFTKDSRRVQRRKYKWWRNFLGGPVPRLLRKQVKTQEESEGKKKVLPKGRSRS